MRIKRAVALLLLFLIFSVWVFALTYVTTLKVPVVFGNPVTVEISQGDSFSQITEQLLKQKVAIKPFWFKWIALQQNKYGKMKAGEYELPVSATMPDILAQLASGKTKQHAITFPEGWTFNQFLQALYENPYISHHPVLAPSATLTQSDNPALLKKLATHGINISHAEGLFFPDTYFFAKHTSDTTVLKMAYEKMQKILQQEWQDKSTNLPVKSAYEALILASIIEKETGLKTERPQIAGVFVRRLQMGMLLQTDPTVIYGMGTHYQGNITRQDLQTATPYNTYRIKGLPPTPIAMPGREAIHAALHPQTGDSLYFVSKGDGSHVFSATLQAHNEAVNLYQRN